MDIFTIAWIAWVAAFLVIEGIAIFNARTQDTLSEKVWTVLRQRKLFWLLGAAFMLWLTTHFLSLGSFT